MNILTKFAIIVLVVVLAVLAYAWSGVYDVAATTPHSSAAKWLMSLTSHRSIARRADDIVVPDLDDEDLVLAGINDFDSMCAGCHGAPGKTANAVGQGLNPTPPDLAESASRLTPAELFWVTRHGVKMTGMPAWSVTHEDEDLWPVVSFMVLLPDMDAAAYEAMLERAQGHGHHASPPTDQHAHPDEAASPAAAGQAHEGEHEGEHQGDQEGEHAHPEAVANDAEAEAHEHDQHDHDH